MNIECAELDVLTEISEKLHCINEMVIEELKQTEIDYHDPDYQMLISVRAVKPEEGK